MLGVFGEGGGTGGVREVFVCLRRCLRGCLRGCLERLGCVQGACRGRVGGV